MADNRIIPRLRKRLQGDFAVGGGTLVGFTADLSAGGIQIQAHLATPLPPGTKIRGRIFLPGKQEIPFEAEVRWTRLCNEVIALRPPTAIGLRFLSPPAEAFYRFLQGASSS